MLFFQFLRGYVNANLQLGEELTIEQLLHILLIPSANDAAVVLAEDIAGSVESFASMMNTKAIEIGCSDTHFVNPNGIHSEEQYSTAYDLALIGKYAMNIPTFKTIVATTSYTLPATNKYDKTDRVFTTTNELIRVNNKDRADNYYYKYANGIKTGYTKYAKNCIVAGSSRDGLEFICVVLGAEQTTAGLSARYLDCKTLFDYAYENYTIKELRKKDSVAKTIEISNATKETKTLNLLIDQDISVLMQKSLTQGNILPEINIKEDLKAPINKDDVVGTIKYEVEGIEYTTNLLAEHDVEESSFLSTLFKIILVFFILWIIWNILKGKQNKNRSKKSKKRSKYVSTYR